MEPEPQEHTNHIIIGKLMRSGGFKYTSETLICKNLSENVKKLNKSPNKESTTDTIITGETVEIKDRLIVRKKHTGHEFKDDGSCSTGREMDVNFIISVTSFSAIVLWHINPTLPTALAILKLAIVLKWVLFIRIYIGGFKKLIAWGGALLAAAEMATAIELSNFLTISTMAGSDIIVMSPDVLDRVEFIAFYALLVFVNLTILWFCILSGNAINIKIGLELTGLNIFGIILGYKLAVYSETIVGDIYLYLLFWVCAKVILCGYRIYRITIAQVKKIWKYAHIIEILKEILCSVYFFQLGLDKTIIRSIFTISLLLFLLSSIGIFLIFRRKMLLTHSCYMTRNEKADEFPINIDFPLHFKNTSHNSFEIMHEIGYQRRTSFGKDEVKRFSITPSKLNYYISPITF